MWNKKLMLRLLGSNYRDNVIAFRRQALRIHINKLVFVDQTNINEAARPIYGLSPKGKKAPVSSRWAPRYSSRIDVMRACVGDQVLDGYRYTHSGTKKEGWSQRLHEEICPHMVA